MSRENTYIGKLNGVQGTYTTQDVINAQMQINEKAEKLQKEIDNYIKNKKGGFEKFQGAKTAVATTEGKNGKRVGQNDYLNAEIKDPFLQKKAQELQKLMKSQDELNRLAGKDFNQYNATFSAISARLDSTQTYGGNCATAGTWFMNVAGNQHLQQKQGFLNKNANINNSRTAVSDLVKETTFEGVDFRGKTFKGTRDAGSANMLIKPLSENDKGVRSIGTLEENLNNLRVGDVLIFEGSEKNKHGHIQVVAGFNEKGEPLFASDAWQGAKMNPYTKEPKKVPNEYFNQKTHVFRGNSVVAEDYGISIDDYMKLQMQHDPKISEKQIIDKLEILRQNPDSKDALKDVENMFAKAEMQMPETFKAQPDNRTNPTELVKDKSFDELNKMAKREIWQTFESETQKYAKDEISKRVSQMTEEELKAHLPSKNAKEMTTLQKVANEKYNEIQLEKAGGFKEAAKNITDEAKAQKDSAKAKEELAKQEKVRIKELNKELKAEFQDVKKGKADGINFAEWNEKFLARLDKKDLDKKENATFSDIVAQKADSKQSFNFSSLFTKDSSNNYAMSNESYKPSESSFLASYNNELKSLQQGGNTMNSTDTMESKESANNIVRHRA